MRDSPRSLLPSPTVPLTIAVAMLLLGCAPDPGDAPTSAASGAQASPPAPAPEAATVAGRLAYPSEYLPPMRVCAVDADDPGRGWCVDTAEGADRYALRVPPGRWWLLAWPQDTGTAGDPGAHTDAVDCIAAAEAGCDDHTLRVVELAPGEQREGVDIIDWYAPPHGLPRPPRGEAPLP